MGSSDDGSRILCDLACAITGCSGRLLLSHWDTSGVVDYRFALWIAIALSGIVFLQNGPSSRILTIVLGGLLGAFVAFLHTPMRTHVDPGTSTAAASGGTIGCVAVCTLNHVRIEEEASEEFAEGRRVWSGARRASPTQNRQLKQ